MNGRELAVLRDRVARARLEQHEQWEQEERGWLRRQEQEERQRRRAIERGEIVVIDAKYWRRLRILKAQLEQVFGPMPKCEQCFRPMEIGRVSKKTGAPARFCSEICYQHHRHLERREERLAAMRDYYAEHREDWKRRKRRRVE